MSSKKLLKIGLVVLVIFLALAMVAEAKTYEVDLLIQGLEPRIITEDYEGYPIEDVVFDDYSVELDGLNMPKVDYIGDYSDVNSTSPFAFNAKITTENGDMLYKTDFYATFFIYDSPAQLNTTTATLNLPYFSNAKYLKIYHNGIEKLSVEIKNNLCNNDRVCNNYENYYSCPGDCGVGAKDKI